VTGLILFATLKLSIVVRMKADFYTKIMLILICMALPPTALHSQTVVVSGLGYPQYLAADASGNLYVADLGCANQPVAPNDCNVYKETLSSGGSYTQSLVASFSTPNVPQGIAVDSSGNVYVSVFNMGVYKETLSGNKYVQTQVGCGFNAPGGIAVDAHGTIYITDRSGSRVNKETTTDTCSTMTLVASGLSAPNSLALDSCGNVYVAQTGAPGSVLKETTSGSGYVQSLVNGSFNTNGLAVDNGGNVYIADGVGHVYKETPSPSGLYAVTTVAQGLTIPTGVAADAAGNVYFVETGFNRIWKSGPSEAVKPLSCPAQVPSRNRSETAYYALHRPSPLSS
jgi:sugar lactone lactonase YvrE